MTGRYVEAVGVAEGGIHIQADQRLHSEDRTSKLSGNTRTSEGKEQTEWSGVLLYRTSGTDSHVHIQTELWFRSKLHVQLCGVFLFNVFHEACKASKFQYIFAHDVNSNQL